MILAVDTSTRYVGIAIFDGSSILAEEIWLSARYHTVELAQAVADNFQRADIKVDKLSALAVATGPGSFTGLRIGMAFIKGLAFSHQLPIVGIPTLDITAAAYPLKDKSLLAILKAGRNRLAVSWYNPGDAGWKAAGRVENLSIKEFIDQLEGDTIITGELTSQLREELTERENLEIASPLLALRSPKYLADLAWKRWKAGQSDNPVTLKPFYLHKDQPIPG